MLAILGCWVVLSSIGTLPGVLPDDIHFLVCCLMTLAWTVTISPAPGPARKDLQCLEWTDSSCSGTSAFAWISKF